MASGALETLLVKLKDDVNSKFLEYGCYDNEDETKFISPLRFLQNQMILFDRKIDDEMLEGLKSFTVDIVETHLISTLKSINQIISHQSESVNKKGLWLLIKHKILQNKLIQFCNKHDVDINKFKKEISSFMEYN